MMPQKIHTIESLKERTIDDAGCWIWTGYHGNKVPNVFHNGKMVQVRKVICELLGKTLPKTVYLNVSCGHGSCVNPDHMKIYTRQQHMDAIRKIAHQSKTRIANVQKHKREHNSKINEQIAQDIRLSDESGPVLAERYGISRTLISRIRRNMVWVNTNHPFLSLLR